MDDSSLLLVLTLFYVLLTLCYFILVLQYATLIVWLSAAFLFQCLNLDHSCLTLGFFASFGSFYDKREKGWREERGNRDQKKENWDLSKQVYILLRRRSIYIYIYIYDYYIYILPHKIVVRKNGVGIGRRERR